MTYKEVLKRIKKENLLIKMTFFTKRNVYECVTNSDVRVFNITYNQYEKLLKENTNKLVKEEFRGFTKRYFKLI